MRVLAIIFLVGGIASSIMYASTHDEMWVTFMFGFFIMSDLKTIMAQLEELP